MPLHSLKKQIRTFRFGNDNQTLVYLQNSGNWNGLEFSSIIASCNGNSDEISAMFSEASQYIRKHYANYPIKWKDVFTQKILSQENSEGSRIGSKIRNACPLIIDEVSLHGGYIYGGDTGDKYVKIPELHQNHFPTNEKIKSTIVTNICGFTDKHECKINTWKGSIGEIRDYQKTIINMFIDREMRQWTDAPNSKKDIILTQLKAIKITSTISGI